jgi:hypothetical protein
VEPGKLQERREVASTALGVVVVRNHAAAGRTADAVGDWLDVDLLHVARSHVLLIGPPSITNIFLDAMRPAFRQPVVECVGGTLSLPYEGTVILRNAESLDERRQLHLSARIASSAIRIVTVCQEPLYPKVIEGAFSSELYYRLNAVTLVANPRAVAARTTDTAAVVPFGKLEDGAMEFRPVHPHKQVLPEAVAET